MDAVTAVCLALTSKRMARIAVKHGITLPARIQRDFKAMCHALRMFARTEMSYRLRPHIRYEINTILHQRLMLRLQAWMPEELMYCSFCGIWKTQCKLYYARDSYTEDLVCLRMMDFDGVRYVCQACHSSREPEVRKMIEGPHKNTNPRRSSGIEALLNTCVHTTSCAC